MQKEKGIDSSTLELEPSLFPDVIWIWNGYQHLSNSRDFGMGGPLRIKISEIVAYLDIYGPFSPEDRMLFFKSINSLDELWIEDYYRNQEQRKKDKETRNRIRK